MLKDLVLKNRSYRGFDESVRISRETLEGFVDCARLCPSSVNKQPLKYFLAWEPEEVEKVQGLTKWARALPEMVLPHPGKRPTGFVVICQDKGIDENLNRYQKGLFCCCKKYKNPETRLRKIYKERGKANDHHTERWKYQRVLRTEIHH